MREVEPVLGTLLYITTICSGSKSLPSNRGFDPDFSSLPCKPPLDAAGWG